MLGLEPLSVQVRSARILSFRNIPSDVPAGGATNTLKELQALSRGI